MVRPADFVIICVLLGAACSSPHGEAPDVVPDIEPLDGAQDGRPGDAPVAPEVGLLDRPEADAPFFTGSPYDLGPYEVTLSEFEPWDTSADVPFDGYAPIGDGPFPVILFLHGFLADTAFYRSMLTHLASHGFVVIAPQNYAADGMPIGKPTALEEAAIVTEFLSWAPANVPSLLAVNADFDRLGMAGHSRGGKVAWLLATEDPLRVLALAGVDPVDGTGGPLGGEDRVVQGPFGFPFPSFVLGTEFGPEKGDGAFASACAPAGDNHVQFFQASAPPAWHILALEHGHNDMLDQENCGFVCSVCVSGSDLQGMRRLCAGSLAAFFAHALAGANDAVSYLSQAHFPIPATLTVNE